MKEFIKYILKENLPNYGIIIKEGVELSEGLRYHKKYNLPLVENIYLPFSDEYFLLINETRNLWKKGLVELCEDDTWLLNTNIGETSIFEGDEVWLDIPFLIEEEEMNEYGLGLTDTEKFLKKIEENPEYIEQLGFKSLNGIKKYLDWWGNAEELDIELRKLMNDWINEAKYQGKTVKLNSPFKTSDGPKKFGVYVKSSNGDVKIVKFGDPSTKVKDDNSETKKSFRVRHKCDQKKDKTTAGYWACNVGRYRKKLGIKS